MTSSATEELDPGKALFVILGNQLFPPALLERVEGCPVFMAEDVGLCTFFRHHKQKIVLFLAAMRSYRDELRERAFEVHYTSLDPDEIEPTSIRDPLSYESKLSDAIEEIESARGAIAQLVLWEVEDRFFEERLQRFAKERELALIFLPSPMFVTSRDAFADWLGERSPRLADFYSWQRKRLEILVEPDGSPAGGQWSFDAENRKSLPRSVKVPEPLRSGETEHVADLIPLVNEHFSDHPGELSAEKWWLPTTRRAALAGLRKFLDERFPQFGPYEDALSRRDPFLFHSVLTPPLNLGLITPEEVIERALEAAESKEVPLPSVEGFVRQIIGWREFVRGIDRHYGARQEAGNFFEHTRKLSPSWWEGTTGLPPLDGVIKKAQRFGYAHHIERLMICANLMVLCEIEPTEAYRWFMEMFVDSSDWVMVPNVYGMGLFADGGVFSTKPYICGSNYLFKMGDETKAKSNPGPGGKERPWWDVVDGLYWRFIDRHREFLRGQARMAQSVRLLDRMDAERLERIFTAAEDFLVRETR